METPLYDTMVTILDQCDQIEGILGEMIELAGLSPGVKDGLVQSTGIVKLIWEEVNDYKKGIAVEVPLGSRAP